MLRLEIIGYSRAIGSMVDRPGLTASHVRGLYVAREEVQNKLKALKDTAKHKSALRNAVNA